MQIILQPDQPSVTEIQPEPEDQFPSIKLVNETKTTPEKSTFPFLYYCCKSYAQLFFLFLDLAWKPAQIRCLIELHRIKKSDFENPRLTKKYVWLEIALEIQNRFPDFAPTRDQVELKYFTRTMHIVYFFL